MGIMQEGTIRKRNVHNALSGLAAKAWKAGFSSGPTQRTRAIDRRKAGQGMSRSRLREVRPADGVQTVQKAFSLTPGT